MNYPGITLLEIRKYNEMVVWKKIPIKSWINRSKVFHSMSSGILPQHSTQLQWFALALHEGHGIISCWCALLPLHLNLRLGSELQLNGTGVHLGCTQQLLHPFHLLTLKCDHGACGAGRCLLLGGGWGDRVWAGGLWCSFIISRPQALGGATPSTSFSHLLGLRCCWWLRGWGGGSRRRALILRLWLSPGTSPPALPGIIAWLVIIILTLRLFGDNRNLLTHL